MLYKLNIKFKGRLVNLFLSSPPHVADRQVFRRGGGGLMRDWSRGVWAHEQFAPTTTSSLLVLLLEYQSTTSSVLQYKTF